MHRTKPMGARSLLDTRSMVSAWCRSIQMERNQKSFVCKNLKSGSFVRVSSLAGSMLATIHSLSTCTRCSRMRSLFLEIVRAAVTLSNVRNLSLRYRNRRHETYYVSALLSTSTIIINKKPANIKKTKITHNWIMIDGMIPSSTGGRSPAALSFSTVTATCSRSCMRRVSTESC